MCGRIGHFVKECPKKKQYQERKERKDKNRKERESNRLVKETQNVRPSPTNTGREIANKIEGEKEQQANGVIDISAPEGIEFSFVNSFDLDVFKKFCRSSEDRDVLVQQGYRVYPIKMSSNLDRLNLTRAVVIPYVGESYILVHYHPVDAIRLKKYKNLLKTIAKNIEYHELRFSENQIEQDESTFSENQIEFEDPSDLPVFQNLLDNVSKVRKAKAKAKARDKAENKVKKKEDKVAKKRKREDRLIKKAFELKNLDDNKEDPDELVKSTLDVEKLKKRLQKLGKYKKENSSIQEAINALENLDLNKNEHNPAIKGTSLIDNLEKHKNESCMSTKDVLSAHLDIFNNESKKIDKKKNNKFDEIKNNQASSMIKVDEKSFNNQHKVNGKKWKYQQKMGKNIDSSDNSECRTDDGSIEKNKTFQKSRNFKRRERVNKEQGANINSRKLLTNNSSKQIIIDDDKDSNSKATTNISNQSSSQSLSSSASSLNVTKKRKPRQRKKKIVDNVQLTN